MRSCPYVWLSNWHFSESCLQSLKQIFTRARWYSRSFIVTFSVIRRTAYTRAHSSTKFKTIDRRLILIVERSKRWFVSNNGRWVSSISVARSMSMCRLGCFKKVRYFFSTPRIQRCQCVKYHVSRYTQQLEN